MFSKIFNFLLKHKYEVLTISLLIQTTGIAFVPENWEEPFRRIILLQSFLPGMVLFHNKKMLYFILTFFFTLVIVNTLEQIGHIESSYKISGVLYILYYLVISAQLYRAIYHSQKLSQEIIFALFSGFILIGIIGSFIFTIIENFHPGSFSNLPKQFFYEHLQYFSFVTILTIGYGDIVPITLQAKKAAFFMGLIGYFYSAFITAIVISKFITSKRED